MKIGIYGGTFSPLHNGHIALAKAFLKQARLDEVWFVVSPQNPFKKDETLVDDNLRLQMVAEALQGEESLKASDVEFHMPRPSYMCNTLRHLRATYPANTFVLLIGGDNWKAFDRWKNYQEILANHTVVVYPRRGDEIEAAGLPEGVKLLDAPLLDVSSTLIRQKVQRGEPVDGLVPASVDKFIREHELYRQS